MYVKQKQRFFDTVFKKIVCFKIGTPTAYALNCMINEKRMPDKSPASRRIHGKRTITFPANIQLNRV
ncbi:MAG TPA: hypothetical protein DEF33_04670 [Clostridiales bacterium]|nr:hypothetical protein [Clostridiales bacterium]